MTPEVRPSASRVLKSGACGLVCVAGPSERPFVGGIGVELALTVGPSAPMSVPADACYAVAAASREQILIRL